MFSDLSGSISTLGWLCYDNGFDFMAWAFKTSDSNSQICCLSAFVARQNTLPPLRHGSRTMPKVCSSPFALMIKVLCPMRKLWGLERAICRSSVFKSVCFSLLSISRAQCQHRPRLRSPKLTLVLWISGASVT